MTPTPAAKGSTTAHSPAKAPTKSRCTEPTAELSRAWIKAKRSARGPQRQAATDESGSLGIWRVLGVPSSHALHGSTRDCRVTRDGCGRVACERLQRPLTRRRPARIRHPRGARQGPIRLLESADKEAGELGRGVPVIPKDDGAGGKAGPGRRETPEAGRAASDTPPTQRAI